MNDAARQAGGAAADRFIAVRKSDILEALMAQSGFADDAEREKFRRLCTMLASIYHYEYFTALERLRNDYYYFNPEVAPHAALDHATLERAYADLVATLDTVLKDANFVELPHAEIGAAHSGRTVLRVEVKAPSTISARCVFTGAGGTSSLSRSPNGSACASARSRPRSTTTSSWWRR
jgi:hypothetical protein